jgi:hypothetical protein
MFAGHFGVGFGAKAAARTVSLGTLFLAAQFVDLLWPLLLQLGIERVELTSDAIAPVPLVFVDYPISHSLLMAVVWGILLGSIHWLGRRSVRAAAVIALCVFSHWLLDLIVHAPDLPVHPGNSPLLGLGLWSHPVLALVIELGIFAAGVAIYVRTTVALDRIGGWGLWLLVGFLALIQLANVLGPPPPDTAAVAWVGHLQWVFVAWAWWIDRHRATSAGLPRDRATPPLRDSVRAPGHG